MRGAKLPERPDSDKRQPDDAGWYARFVSMGLSKLQRGQEPIQAAKFIVTNAIRLLCLLIGRSAAAAHVLSVLREWEGASR